MKYKTTTAEFMKGTKVIFVDPEMEYKELCQRLHGDKSVCLTKIDTKTRNLFSPFYFSISRCPRVVQ